MQLGKALAQGVAADEIAAAVEIVKPADVAAPVAETKIPETVA